MRLLALVSVLGLVACGSSGGSSYQSPAPPTPPPTWDQVAAVIQADCAKCHNGTTEPTFNSGAVFKGSQAAAKLTSGEMPPAPNTISDGDKSLLLAYLKS